MRGRVCAAGDEKSCTPGTNRRVAHYGVACISRLGTAKHELH
jgi:hypothetical protein